MKKIILGLLLSMSVSGIYCEDVLADLRHSFSVISTMLENKLNKAETLTELDDVMAETIAYLLQANNSCNEINCKIIPKLIDQSLDHDQTNDEISVQKAREQFIQNHMNNLMLFLNQDCLKKRQLLQINNCMEQDK